MTLAEDLVWTKAAMEGIRMNEAREGEEEEGLRALGEAGSLEQKEEKAKRWA